MIAQTTLRKWTIRHAIVFSCIGVAVLAGSALFGVGSTEFHLTLLVVLLFVLGIPHGALDYALAKQFLRPQLNRSWGIWFVAFYLLIMGIVLAVWWIHPGASFAAFLALTLYHFGTGDATPTRSSPIIIRIAEILGRGGAVLTFPAAFNKQEILLLFSFLVPEPSAHTLITMLTVLMPLSVTCLLICLIWSIFNFVYRKKPYDLSRAAEIMVMALLFTFLPALLAFSVYFSFLHSVRHMLYLSAGGTTGSAITALIGMIRKALPVTAAALVIGGVAYLMLGGVSYERPQLVRVIFIGIASMTYPHALVIALAGHVGAIPILREVRS